MTQPPSQPPQQGGFGAPYDPPPGAPQPSPGYGYPPQQPGPHAQPHPQQPGPHAQPHPQQPGPYPQAPGPYAQPYPQQPGPYAQASGPYAQPYPQQPGPYAQAPGPYGPQPGYGYPPQPPTVTAPPTGGPGGGGRFKGRTGVVVGAVLAVLLLAGGGVWLATGDGGGGQKKPVAGPGGESGKSGGSSGTDKDETFTGPTAAELNAGRKQGEAKVAWLAANGVDLPQYGEKTHGPWFSGDIVAKAMYRKVTGYAVTDGDEKWSLRLPTDICASPAAPTADGKVVVGIEDNVSEKKATCSVLQMIDLRTGKAGWKKTVDRSASQDGLSHVAMSISGDTVTFGRNTASDAFRVSDGKELFGKREGVCQPFAFTGGARMIAAVSCQAEPADPVSQQVQEVDPVTGAPKWTYALKPGWSVTHVFSVRPPVISVAKEEEWAVVVLNENGTYRSQMAGGDEDYGFRCGEDSVQEGGNLDGCAGVAADTSRFYFSTQPEPVADAETNKVVAFDLATGKPVWKTPAPGGRLMLPLRMEGGKVLVHVQAGYRKAGEIGTLDASTGTYATLLKHPASAADTEDSLFLPRVTYRDGRSFLLPQRIGADEDEAEMAATGVLVFGP
ncbi:PQQ-binding-like beta-propeller repeat protein [Streptomyces pratensis]|uniref:outer membrane protein assembly factor BamB family protein n=1 Tax=Streptomyces pratensis TaxID=1169025 RepID=UPI003793F633